MHLDTVFTQVDTAKYVVHPGILAPLTVFEITPAESGIHFKEIKGTLQEILQEYTKQDHVELIPCGGEDVIASRREQWNDGSNTLCVEPGKVLVYDRNYVTNQILQEKGIQVLEMTSSELSRGRGGPRCMSMPIYRDE
jgi:arginine deiminase